MYFFNLLWKYQLEETFFLLFFYILRNLPINTVLRLGQLAFVKPLFFISLSAQLFFMHYLIESWSFEKGRDYNYLHFTDKEIET